jgi:60 kDa SS-A/Ro ribonucleoprotein
MVLNAQFSTKTAPAGAPAGAPAATTTNASGRPAFELGDTEALAQFALTGCLNDCFYTKAEDQLETVLRL